MAPAATMAVPDSLQHRIDLFRDGGRVFRQANELFAENSWVRRTASQLPPHQHYVERYCPAGKP